VRFPALRDRFPLRTHQQKGRAGRGDSLWCCRDIPEDPAPNGKSGDIVLGYNRLDGQEQAKSYFGATTERYGNRIAGGQFTTRN
jgi:hypothetical protein